VRLGNWFTKHISKPLAVEMNV